MPLVGHEREQRHDREHLEVVERDGEGVRVRVRVRVRFGVRVRVRVRVRARARGRVSMPIISSGGGGVESTRASSLSPKAP